MEKINIAELLKDCPKDMELDCTMFDNVTLDRVSIYDNYPIKIKTHEREITLNKYGQYFDPDFAKCVIFPKGKTTWKGFVPPPKFKNGDIIITTLGSIAIIKECIGTSYYAHCIWLGDQLLTGNDITIGAARFATEEEKQELFQAIKDNGIKWNEETKTLEKLEDDKGNISDGYHTFNELYEYRLLYNASMFNELAKQGLYDVHKSKRHSDGTIPFDDENWFIVQAELPTGQISNHYEMKDWELFNVPEKEKANPYDGHTPQDVAKRLRDFLSLKKLIEPKFKIGYRIKKNKDVMSGIVTNISDDGSYKVEYQDGGISYVSLAYQDEWELVSDKFDITTLVPFESRVLVRHNRGNKWCGSFFSHIDGDFHSHCYKFVTTAGKSYPMCIPYEDNQHLLGTTNDCNEYYKTWE